MALSKKSSTGKASVKKITKEPVKKSAKKSIKPRTKVIKPTPPPTKMLSEGVSPEGNSVGSFLSKGKTLLKSIKPIYIFLGCIVLAAIIYFLFSKPDAYKQENKKLKAEINQIQKERDKIADSIKTLKYEYTKLEDSANVKLQLLDEINQRMVLIEQRVSNSFDELSKIKNGVNGLNAQIKSATENPVKRVGDDLLKSLKNKIN